MKPHDSYHHADRTFVMDMAMQGRFHQVPELLYFRRDHENRAERANPSIRSRCANLDPKRAKGFNPAPRLLAEYALGYVGLIRRAPIDRAEKQKCYRHLAEYLRQPGHQEGRERRQQAERWRPRSRCCRSTGSCRGTRR